MSQVPEPTQADRDTEQSMSSAPRPTVLLFAAVFVIAMLYNLAHGGSSAVTIFLGSATMLTLGIDVGKITGRR